MQNWPGPQREGADVRRGECNDLTAGEGPGEHDDGIDRRHLGVHRDRVRPRGCGLDQGEPGAAGAGEADRVDPRVAHQLLPELDPALRVAVEHEREDPGGQAVRRDRARDGAGDQLAGARVGGVALDDDRAAGGERGRGVAAGGREREREVAGAEHGHGAERDHPLPEVRSRQRGAVRQRRIEPDAEVVAAPDDAGKHPQLAGRPAELARDPRLGQPALGDRRLDDGVAVGLELGRDRVEERAPLLRRRRAVDGERLGGRGRGGLDRGHLGVGTGDDRVGGERHGSHSPAFSGSARARCRRSGEERSVIVGYVEEGRDLSLPAASVRLAKGTPFPVTHRARGGGRERDRL